MLKACERINQFGLKDKLFPEIGLLADALLALRL